MVLLLWNTSAAMLRYRGAWPGALGPLVLCSKCMCGAARANAPGSVLVDKFALQLHAAFFDLCPPIELTPSAVWQGWLCPWQHQPAALLYSLGLYFGLRELGNPSD